MERVNELIKQQLSLLVQKELAEELGMISITAVGTSRDLKSAKVYVSGLPIDKIDSSLKKLQNKARNFRHALGKKLTLKDMPHLQFIYDQSQDKINRVEELLNKIEREKNES